jgi:general stress protein 26
VLCRPEFKEKSLKVVDQTRPESAALAGHLLEMRTAMLAVRDTQCRLVSQPMTPLEMDASGAIWLMTSRNGRMARHVRANLPADTVNLSFSDEGKSTFVSITAKATLSDDARRKRELWSTAARPWFPDGANNADLTLLCLEPTQAEIWDGPDSTVVRLLALAGSVVSGQPIGLGDHEALNDLDAHRV